MLEALSERLGAIFDRLSNRGRLSETDVAEVLREVRIALLEADVNLAVAKDFVNAIKERAVGADVLQSLTPGQSVIKIVHDELVDAFGRRGSAPAVLRRAADGLHAGRPARLGKNDAGRQTRAASQGTGPPHAAGRGRRLPAGGDRAAQDARASRSICRCTIRAPAIRSRSRATASPKRAGSGSRPSSSTRPAACRSTRSSWTSWPRSKPPSSRSKSCSSPTR